MSTNRVVKSFRWKSFHRSTMRQRGSFVLVYGQVI